MNWTTEDEITNAVNILNECKTDAADLRHRSRMIMYRFLSEIEHVTDRKNLSRKDLAKLIGTSPSYITQLFRGNKLINLETLAKLEKALDLTFKIRVDSSIEEWVDSNLDFHEIFAKKYHSKDGFWAFHQKKQSNALEYGRIKNDLEVSKKEEKYLKLVS